MSSSKRVQYKYIYAVVILFWVITLGYLLNPRYGSTDHSGNSEHLEAQKATITDVFLLKEEITLTGDSLNPVFTIWDPLVLDSIIVLSDFVGNRILFFHKNNRLIRSVGRQGTGPSEFQLPYGVVVDRNQHYYVNDRGNMRVVKVEAILPTHNPTHRWSPPIIQSTNHPIIQSTNHSAIIN